MDPWKYISTVIFELAFATGYREEKSNKTFTTTSVISLDCNYDYNDNLFFSFLKLYITKSDSKIYLLPNNFEGSFRIVYGEKCGIIPPSENGNLVLQIPENGILIIQPEGEAGLIDDEYYLLDENGNREELKTIWGFSNKKPNLKGVYRGSSGQMDGVKIYGDRIQYTDFFLFNKNTTLIDDEVYSLNNKIADSLMIEAVNECRKMMESR